MSFINGLSDFKVITSFQPSSTATQRFCSDQIWLPWIRTATRIPCCQDGNTTSTIPHKYAPRQKQAFEYGCADGSGQGSRRGSHVYEINTRLWNFGRPQPRIGGLSVAETEGVRRQSRSETSRRAAETRKARKRAVDQI